VKKFLESATGRFGGVILLIAITPVAAFLIAAPLWLLATKARGVFNLLAALAIGVGLVVVVRRRAGLRARLGGRSRRPARREPGDAGAGPRDAEPR
jgi:hypothetical protein